MPLIENIKQPALCFVGNIQLHWLEWDGISRKQSYLNSTNYTATETLQIDRRYLASMLQKPLLTANVALSHIQHI